MKTYLHLPIGINWNIWRKCTTLYSLPRIVTFWGVTYSMTLKKIKKTLLTGMQTKKKFEKLFGQGSSILSQMNKKKKNQFVLQINDFVQSLNELKSNWLNSLCFLLFHISTNRGGYIFSLQFACLCVCLSVCQWVFSIWLSISQILLNIQTSYLVNIQQHDSSDD